MAETNPKIKKLYESAKLLYEKKDFKEACVEFSKILEIVRKKKLIDTIEWAEKNLKHCQDQMIKHTILDLGTKFTRLEIKEILEKIGDFDEKLVANVIISMINNQEIHAEFFSSTNAVVFNQQANIDQIEKLISMYDEWELDTNSNHR